VRALVFDVFGTLVDWRASIISALERFGAERGISCDWAGLVDAWRGVYVPSMDRVRKGERPWAKLDTLHAESLDALAERFGLPSLDAADRDWIVKRWHELEPWPDVRAGLERLRERHVLSTLSNGNVSLLIDLARHANLRFDTILSAELFGHYKPDPEVYLGAAGLLGFEPYEVMMVAAHSHDMKAAAALGMPTAFIARPGEYGPGKHVDLATDLAVDIRVRGIDELADLLCG